MSDAKEPEDEEMKIVSKAVQELSEHFDSVHVFVTRYQDNDTGTFGIQKGAGNFFARVGQIKEWCVRQDSREWEKGRQDEASSDE